MVFQNSFRTDNPSRRARAQELANDCCQLVARLQEAYKGIEAEAPALLEAAKAGRTSDAPTWASFDPGLGTAVRAFLAKQAALLVAKPAMERALGHGLTATLPRLGPSMHVPTMDGMLTRWEIWRNRVGGYSVGLGAAFLGDAISSALGDEEVYEKTRKAIHDLVPARLAIQADVLECEAILDDLRYLHEILSDGADPSPRAEARLAARLERRLRRSEGARMPEALEEAARARLRRLDEARGSWTAEDHD